MQGAGVVDTQGCACFHPCGEVIEVCVVIITQGLHSEHVLESPF